MAKYIDCDVLIDNLQKFAPDDYSANVNNIIMSQPKANVKEIIYAHWICKPDCGVTECSHCHRSIEEYVEYPYCMYCGAEMSEVK
jgi:hypothetical protein|nr:MAG TPA: DNA-directed RNA polymerase [Bacteriophage sp.]